MREDDIGDGLEIREDDIGDGLGIREDDIGDGLGRREEDIGDELGIRDDIVHRLGRREEDTYLLLIDWKDRDDNGDGMENGGLICGRLEENKVSYARKTSGEVR